MEITEFPFSEGVNPGGFVPTEASNSNTDSNNTNGQTATDIAEGKPRIIKFQKDVTLYYLQQTFEGGILCVATDLLYWWNPQTNRGYAFEYQNIIIHAVSRDTSSFPHMCIFCQLETGDDLENEEEVDNSVVRFVPADNTSLNDIYQAICDGQTLHPDPEDQEDEEEEQYYQDATGVAFDAHGQVTLDRLSNMLNVPEEFNQEGEDEEEEEEEEEENETKENGQNEENHE